MASSFRWIGEDEGEFVNDGDGPTAGGLLFAAVPDRLRAEFGPTCVVLWYRDGHPDRVLYGETACRVRNFYLTLIRVSTLARRLASAG